jgi:hypothetical protein
MRLLGSMARHRNHNSGLRDDRPKFMLLLVNFTRSRNRPDRNSLELYNVVPERALLGTTSSDRECSSKGVLYVC